MLQPLQTVIHSQREVCRPQKSLTAAIICMFCNRQQRRTSTATAQHGLHHWAARKHTNSCVRTDCNRCKPCYTVSEWFAHRKIANIGVISRTFATDSRKNIHSNCPARFAPLGSKKTHVRVRQNRLQPLQTLQHRE